jgi:hypothetical protein
MFRFKLNGVELVDQPIGWENFVETITRDEDLHLFTLTYENDLTFVGDGYKILNDVFLANYCGEVTLTIEQSCDGGFELVATLLLKVTDLDQNLERCTAQAKLTDDSFYGMIFNNREVPVRLSAEFSKNGVAIGQCPYTEIRMVQPESSGLGFPEPYPDLRRTYEQVDALTHVLKFITDNRITSVQSDYLDALVWQPDLPYELAFLDKMKFGFINGQELRAPSGYPPTVTFAGIMKTLFSLHNLFARIDGTVMRLEPYDFFFQENELAFTNIRDLIRSTDTTKLYSKVVFGSPSSDDERTVSATYPSPVNWSMPFVDIIAHGKQEYPLTGVCQTDVALDLIADHIYDSNSIEKVMFEQANLPAGERPNQEKDGDTFYIQYTTYTDSTPDTACFSILFLLPTTPTRGWTFNPYLWHSEVISRHNVQSDLVLYEANNSDNFQAEAEAPNAYVEDFASPLVYFSPTDFTSQTYGLIQSLFGTNQWDPLLPSVSLPIPVVWGGLLNNSATTCQVPESICVDPPINIQFDNDSTNGNFDPNNNWDTTDYYFEAPSTGVYGFELNAILNKIRDQVSYSPNVNDYFNIDTYVQTNPLVPSDPPKQENIIFPRNFWVRIYITIFDSSDNVVSEQLTYGSETVTEQYGYNFVTIPDGTPVPSIVTSWQNPGNTPAAISALGTYRYKQGQDIGQNWNQNFQVNRQHFVYLESGQRVRPRIEITTYTHPTPIQAAQRVVQYGVMPGSIFKTFYIRTGGGNFAPVNPLLYRSLKYDFNQPMTADIWKQIKENGAIGSKIGISEINLTQAHVSRIARTLATGETTFEMMANRNQQFI